FTLDAQVYTDFSSCFAFAEFEGHLYSWPFFQNTNLPSSIGISMNYKVNYSNDFNYSTNALGSFLCQKVPLGEESYFSWNLEANFIFLEASKVAKKNYYNFGPEAKLTLMVESRYVNFRCFSEFDYVFMQWIYHSKNFASIDFKILKNWSIGISDLFWCINGESFYNFISISTKMIL
ncbi:MAG: hypothetical protein K6G52_03175, partial [Treponemataceae bacterium]|nr:hypothetical protein [Treponemataceae bacterium]